ncbi:uncharacterized protein [Dysidea avara]|uniref:uncharacterized protein n=1 Tax=Dysidea avara TaxID=196820 RepID=UPI0033220262
MRQLHQKRLYTVKAGITNTISDGNEIYTEMMLPQLHRDNTIVMGSNPSYGSYTGQGSIQPREDDVPMESNPSYGVIRREDNSNMGCDVTIEPNPSYGVATRMGTNTRTTSDSDVTITPNPAYCVFVKVKK